MRIERHSEIESNAFNHPYPILKTRVPEMQVGRCLGRGGSALVGPKGKGRARKIQMSRHGSRVGMVIQGMPAAV